MVCDKKIINRLKRAEGQLRGIQKMIAEEKECREVITQLSAVRSSVDKIMGLIVAENLMQCLENPDSDVKIQEEKIKHAIDMIVKK